MLKTYKFKNSL